MGVIVFTINMIITSLYDFRLGCGTRRQQASQQDVSTYGEARSEIANKVPRQESTQSRRSSLRAGLLGMESE
jgi:hypothetical protein